LFFFFQAEDGIRDWSVTGVQTCALPISTRHNFQFSHRCDERHQLAGWRVSSNAYGQQRDRRQRFSGGRAGLRYGQCRDARSLDRSEEHTSELQSLTTLASRLLLETNTNA